MASLLANLLIVLATLSLPSITLATEPKNPNPNPPPSLHHNHHHSAIFPSSTQLFWLPHLHHPFFRPLPHIILPRPHIPFFMPPHHQHHHHHHHHDDGGDAQSSGHHHHHRRHHHDHEGYYYPSSIACASPIPSGRRASSLCAGDRSRSHESRPKT